MDLICVMFMIIVVSCFPGTRLNADKTDLSEILPEEVEEEVKAAAEISMGTEVGLYCLDFLPFQISDSAFFAWNAQYLCSVYMKLNNPA